MKKCRKSVDKKKQKCYYKKVPSKHQTIKEKTEELVIKNTTQKGIKTEITSFLFCSKKSKKVFWKNVEKVLTKKKRYSIIQIVPTKKEQKSTLKSKQ